MITELKFRSLRLPYTMQMKNNRIQENIRPFILILALALFMSFCLDMTNNTLRSTSYVFLIVVFALLVVAFWRNISKDAVVWTMVAGAFLKASYILYTPVWERQHDVIDFGAGEGHAAYIEYILYNRSLPDFDPRSVWAFFQPPLHHFVSAAWMWINIRLKIAERHLYENVQVLPLCYMLVMTLVIYGICRELSMTNRATFITMLIVSFHPIYVLLSGSINNDALALVLSAFSVYVALLWYKKPSFGKIILLALSVGLAMMAKLSSALVAPPIGVMILYKIVTDVKSKKSPLFRYICQVAAFAAVVFPLGLWWPVRNLLKWDMPVNYIPEVGEQLVKTDIFSRLFDLRTSTVYPCMVSHGQAYDEYNVILAMIKTSLFGEYDYSLLSGKITPFATLTFIFGILSAVTGIAAVVYILVKKDAPIDLGEKILLGGSVVCLLGGYFLFALSYSNFSAQDFRYSALAIAIIAVFIGLLYDRLTVLITAGGDDKSIKKISKVKNGIYVICVIFALSAFITYMLVGYYTIY